MGCDSFSSPWDDLFHRRCSVNTDLTQECCQMARGTAVTPRRNLATQAVTHPVHPWVLPRGTMCLRLPRCLELQPGGLHAEPSLDPWVEGGQGVRLRFWILGSCSVPTRVAPPPAPFPGGTRVGVDTAKAPPACGICPLSLGAVGSGLGWLQLDPPNEFSPCPGLPRPVERRSYRRQSDKRNGLFKGCVVC